MNTHEQQLGYINGTLSCFCDKEYADYGYSAALKAYRSDGLD